MMYIYNRSFVSHNSLHSTVYQPQITICSNFVVSTFSIFVIWHNWSASVFQFCENVQTKSKDFPADQTKVYL